MNLFTRRLLGFLMEVLSDIFLDRNHWGGTRIRPEWTGLFFVVVVLIIFFGLMVEVSIIQGITSHWQYGNYAEAPKDLLTFNLMYVSYHAMRIVLSLIGGYLFGWSIVSIYKYARKTWGEQEEAYPSRKRKEKR